MNCARCGNTSDFYMQVKGAQTGLYCKKCLRWQKWVGKKDIDSYRRKGITLVSPTADIEPTGLGIEGIEGGNIGIQEPEDAEIVAKPVKIEVKSGDKLQDLKEQEQEIEQRVQVRVELEIAKIREEYETKVKEEVEEEEDKGCSLCRGEEGLEGEEAKVDVGMYSGLMAITTKNGEIVQGFFPVKYCLKCGKKQ